MGIVILFLIAPAQNARLVQQPSCLSLFSINSFPLGDRNFLRAVAASESRKSILEYSCLMIAEVLVFCAFGPNIKSHFGLVKRPVCHAFITGTGSRHLYRRNRI